MSKKPGTVLVANLAEAEQRRTDRLREGARGLPPSSPRPGGYEPTAEEPKAVDDWLIEEGALKCVFLS